MVDAPDTVAIPAATVSAPATDTVIPQTPIVEAAPVLTDTAPAIETVAPTVAETPTPSLSESVLGDTKPSEVKKTEEAVKSDDKVPESKTPEKSEIVETKVELPVYEPFKLPENVSLDKEPLDAFSKILGEIETGKLDHAGMQESGQKLIDLATKATTDSINRLNDYYVQFHENQKKEWFESFKKDPDMGGDKLETTVGMLRDAVENYGGTPEQISEFRQLMKETGVGNHPAVTRLLYNMQQKINKYTTEADNGNGGSNRIVPGAKPAPSKIKDYQRFYSSS